MFIFKELILDFGLTAEVVPKCLLRLMGNVVSTHVTPHRRSSSFLQLTAHQVKYHKSDKNKKLETQRISSFFLSLPHVLQHLIDQDVWIVVRGGSPAASAVPMIQFFHVTSCHIVDTFHSLQPGDMRAEPLLLLLILEPLHPEEGRVVARRRRSHVIKGTAGSPVGGANRFGCFERQVPLRSATGDDPWGVIRADAGQYPSNHPPTEETWEFN